jgi:hypothetical protein
MAGEDMMTGKGEEISEEKLQTAHMGAFSKVSY